MPVPIPDRPDATVSHDAALDDVHGQPVEVVTVTLRANPSLMHALTSVGATGPRTRWCRPA